MDIMRIAQLFDPDPHTKRVDEYQETIKGLRTRMLRKRGIDSLMSVVNGVCEFLSKPSSIPEVFYREIAAVMASMGSPMRDVTGFELGVCMTAALTSSAVPYRRVNEWSGWKASDALAAGAWSALSFASACSGPKLDELRKWAVAHARNGIFDTSSIARDRHERPGNAQFRKRGRIG